MKVRITKGITAGKTGAASWDAEKAKWMVQFRSPWVGYYHSHEFDIIV